MNNKKKRISCQIFILSILFSLLCVKPVYAATVISIDEDEYNLYVDEYPDGIYENIYAKFRTAKGNSDDYYLNLSSYDSEEIFTAALDSAKINYTDKLQVSMTAALYRQDDEEDKKVNDTIQLLLPLPDDAQEHPEDTSLYSVSGGKAKPVTYTLVEADEVKYAQFTLSSYTTYGFLFNDPYSYEELEEYEDEYEEDEYEEDEYEEDEEEVEEEPIDEPTPIPSETPTATPTDKPEDSLQEAPTLNPVKDKQTASSENTASDSSQNSSVREKDSVPRTSDDFPLTALITGGLLSLCIFVFAVIKIKK